MSNLSVEFGALVSRLSRQLRPYKLPPAEVKHFQQDADAITRLAVRGLLSEADAKHSRRRLVTRIAARIEAASIPAPPAEGRGSEVEP